MQDYVAPRASASGRARRRARSSSTLNANGERDPGEPGIPRFLIWADYDDDGVRDRRRAVRDLRQAGPLRHPRHPAAAAAPTGCARSCCRAEPGARRVRRLEVLVPERVDARRDRTAPGGRFGCAWGPINVETTPNATGRDFGNWFPAQLTVEKELYPAADPGRFDLLVNGSVALAEAGDGATITLSRPARHLRRLRAGGRGRHRPGRLRLHVCAGASRAAWRHGGPVVAGLALTAGSAGDVHLLQHPPRLAGDRDPEVGPDGADAGDTLRYTLYVTNPGDVAFPAAASWSTDPAATTRPALVDKEDASGADDTPRTLDPGDTWIYRCSHRTSDGGADCEPTTVDNTGTVTAPSDGITVTDSDSSPRSCSARTSRRPRIPCRRIRPDPSLRPIPTSRGPWSAWPVPAERRRRGHRGPDLPRRDRRVHPLARSAREPGRHPDRHRAGLPQRPAAPRAHGADAATAGHPARYGRARALPAEGARRLPARHRLSPGHVRRRDQGLRRELASIHGLDGWPPGSSLGKRSRPAR